MILVSVLLNSLRPWHTLDYRLEKILIISKKFNCIKGNLGTNSGKSLTMHLRLFLNHSQRRGQRPQVQQYADRENLCWGLWFLSCVCTHVILLTFNIHKKAVCFTGAKLFYERRLRLEVLPNSKQVLNQQLSSAERESVTILYCQYI